MDSLLEPEDRLRQQYLSAPWGELGRSATLGLVSLFSKFLLQVLNNTRVHGLDCFRAEVLEREEGVGLITVSNHTSTLDDPMLLSAMLPWTFFLTEHVHGRVRWSLCARELCYSNHLFAQFFKSGKTLPIERGAGPNQPVMGVIAAEVGRGSWVHIFPEGRINYTGQLGKLRWGVGKIFCDAVAHSETVPRVVPLYHSGMGRILPRRGRIPHAGHTVTVLVGEPLQMEDLAIRCRATKVASEEEQRCVWQDVATRIEKVLRALEAQVPPNFDQVPRGHGIEASRRSEGALPVGGEAQEP